MTFAPTEEQDDIIGMHAAGVSMAVEAGAGTGKSTTLRLCGEASHRRGAYMAYNASAVTDARARMPRRVKCFTAHALAKRQNGHLYFHRVGGDRILSHQLAAALRLDRAIVVRYGSQSKVLQPAFLAGHVLRAVRTFCNTADPDIGPQHLGYIDGIDLPDEEGRRTYTANNEVRTTLEPALRRAWSDIANPNGVLPFTHDCYLKLWQMDSPLIPGEYIMVDEAQDLSPVMVDAIRQQEGVQVVFVGDSQQAIYGWRGAENALASIDADHRSFLTQSWRFGPEIANVANTLLGALDADLRLVGAPGLDSRLEELDDGYEAADAVLCRTNARAVEEVLGAIDAGRRPHLVGGGDEVLRFARAAADLKEHGRTGYPDLACFTSWGEVQDYCLAPGTRVLTADLEWRPIERLVAGDTIVAFDEECAPGNGGRRYRTATVEASRVIERPVRRVWMEDGTEVVASIEHRWLVKSGSSLRWKATDYLRPGDEIASVGQTWEADESRDGGWLAGLFDGEGWVGRGGLAVSQNEGRVLERARWALKERGFTFGESPAATGCIALTVSGPIGDRLRLLGSLRPERLLAKAECLWDGVRVEARVRAVVRGVEALGMQAVVAVRTDARTLIAEGLLSHNCERDPQGADLALMVNLIDTFGHDVIAEALGNQPPEAAADVVVSTAHKAKGREWPKVRLANDFPDEHDPNNLEQTRLAYVAVTRAQEVLDCTAASLVDRLLVSGLATADGCIA